MRPATEATVGGDFGDVSVAAEGTQTRFLRSAGRFVVEAADRDGVYRTFPVMSVIGTAPLEQYVLEYPGGRGQIPTVAWDVDSQRWFSIHGDEAIAPTDPLHWTGRLQNWNGQCAECHATNLKKGYSAATDTYATTYSEAGVGCEACHGRGSRHVAHARSGTLKSATGLEIDFGKPATWTMDTSRGIARLQSTPNQYRQVDACGRCHSRRTAQSDDYVHGRPLLDTHRPALIEAPLYYPDGQIRDEVFEWGSFLQSRMYAAGVECTDCHEPHSAVLKATGDALCARCHTPTVFAVPAHHHHPEAVACVDCHMPETVYMAIDPRRDHGFHVPRPDLTVRHAIPNACAACHPTEPPTRLSAAIERWYPEGRQRGPHFADAFADGDVNALLAVAQDESQAGIVRASAWNAMRGRFDDSAQLDALREALRDDDALVRFGALQAIDGLPGELTLQMAAPLLNDSVKNVRIDAARLVAPHEARLPAESRTSLRSVIDQLIAAETYNTDRGSGHLNLGNFHASVGDYAQAERSYLAGLRVEPTSVALPLNLADLHRRLGDDASALTLLEALRDRAPDEPVVAEALALTLVRLERYDDAIAALDEGIANAPDADRLKYLRKLAVQDRGVRD